MMIVSVLLDSLEKIKNNQFTDEMKATLKRQIDFAAGDRTLDPREETEANRKLLNAAILVALGTAEELYGEGDETEFHCYPIFKAQPRSQIVPLAENHLKFAIVIGECARSWEDVFYDICHESLHLLNPVINVMDDTVEVCALEEGVAVKFAEQMYEKYIKPYCGKTPSSSPVNYSDSQYFMAYYAVKKIPDDVLKETRKSFGRFSNIDDVNKFKALVGSYVSDKEIEILTNPFVYR